MRWTRECTASLLVRRVSRLAGLLLLGGLGRRFRLVGLLLGALLLGLLLLLRFLCPLRLVLGDRLGNQSMIRGRDRDCALARKPRVVSSQELCKHAGGRESGITLAAPETEVKSNTCRIQIDRRKLRALLPMAPVVHLADRDLPRVESVSGAIFGSSSRSDLINGAAQQRAGDVDDLVDVAARGCCRPHDSCPDAEPCPRPRRRETRQSREAEGLPWRDPASSWS